VGLSWISPDLVRDDEVAVGGGYTVFSAVALWVGVAARCGTARGPVVAPGFSRTSIVILVAGREPNGAVIIERACDRVFFVNADDRGSVIGRIFEKQSLAAPPAGFEPAHTAPERVAPYGA
jgi:hypothetical protein